MTKREGRGRLSTLDELPPEADPHVQWAVEELQARQRTQTDILFELNDKLAVIGCGPISSSAFNRYSTRLAATIRRLQETRDIAKAVTARLGPDQADNTTIMIVEMLKGSVHSILEGGQVGPKEVMELARGLQSALAAEKASGDNRVRRQAEIRSKIEKATEAAADGLSEAHPEIDKKAVLKKIREDVYGIFEKP